MRLSNPLPLILPLLLLTHPSHAQESPPPSPPSLTIANDPASGYVYHGCYNETTALADTTGARALADGTNLVAPGDMTAERCWEFCRTGAGDSSGGKGGRFKFAGLEYARFVFFSFFFFFFFLVAGLGWGVLFVLVGGRREGGCGCGWIKESGAEKRERLTLATENAGAPIPSPACPKSSPTARATCRARATRRKPAAGI
jgi:hypothetical protein